MLEELFPRFHRKYLSLPIFGVALERFAHWLFDRGYPRHLVRRHLRTTRKLDGILRYRGCRSLGEIAREPLRACSPANSQDDCNLASTVRRWELYLDERGFLRKPELTPSESLLAEYSAYLRKDRGVSCSTIKHHCSTVSQFLQHLGYNAEPSRIAETDEDILEAFVSLRGQRVSRASLQHEVAHLRSLLRFLAARGEVRSGLDTQIDTPRLYRGEQLPRSLSWDTVHSFLCSIDRATPMGLRDYAIFLLIATYGLRAIEIVSLKLDDIQWRLGRIRIPRHKTNTPLVLPLMDDVGESLVAYLRHGRPELRYPELFLRCRAPAGVLKPTAVAEAFQRWTRRSGLDIPFQGSHCLRHSFAVHLLRQGTPLKTIGDLLGHRSAESTCVYLRLAVEDLRDVALCLPHDHASSHPKKVKQ